MTMREISALIEAVFEFNRESVKHMASAEFQTNPKDGGVIWFWVFDLDNLEHGTGIEFSIAIKSSEDALEACKRLADVIAEEKSRTA